MLAIPGYHLLEHLYQGENSLVLRALAESGRDPVILKVLNQSQPAQQEIARFKRQYSIGMRFNHPNITRPLAQLQASGRWVLVFADMGGHSLDRQEADGVALETFFAIALQLCAALKEVHAKNIIHKDINPSNLIWNDVQQRLELIDFGISSELSEEVMPLTSPNVLEGTLHYLSPEQSGRMNRVVDYRTDYYSMGATLYHLLAGRPPFEADDPMELVHCHLARAPDWNLPALKRAPPQLLAVLRRLLEKDAERRYQSMDGLRGDLELCQKLARGGQANPDWAAQTLLSDQRGVFQIPQKLIGREREIDIMLATFERVSGVGGANGKSRMLLLSGQSGIGKSALVHEIHKPMVARRGYFVAGKFEQFRRNIPYSSLLQAFQDLIRQILSESASRVQLWAEQFRAALGDNAGVIAAIIPELCHVIGPCAPVEALPPVEAQNQLNHLFARLMQVCATQRHPLVLFLDDLQWVDQPSLGLIERFLLDPEGGYLLIIGACRDNEVDAAHPLTAFLGGLEKAGAPVQTLTLAPLARDDIAALVAQTLQTTAAECESLTLLCQRKTLGNPFFLTQFLHEVYGEGLLSYNYGSMRWDWDLAKLEYAAHTANVVDLMLGKLRRLPPATQNLLQLAASIGTEIDLATLALVSGVGPWEAQRTLWPALETNILRPCDGAYKYLGEGGAGPQDDESSAVVEAGQIGYRFLHDRVQQAAYALADEGDKPRRHLEIGRCLLRDTPPEKQAAKLFGILAQLNAGRALVSDPVERIRLAQLNLQAGGQARLASAYRAGLQHMQIGIALLPIDAWESCFDLMFNLQLGLAETAYLSGEFDLAETVYPVILGYCQSDMQYYRCFRVQSEQLLLQARHKEGVAIQIEGLRVLGFDLPLDPARCEQLTGAVFGEVAALVQGRSMESILEAEEMQGWRLVAAMELLYCISRSSYMAGLTFLNSLAGLTLARLTLLHGTSNQSALGFLYYAFLLIRVRKAYSLGYEYGKLAIDMADRRNHAGSRGHTYSTYVMFLHHWCQAFDTSTRYFDECFALSMASGNLAIAGYSVVARSANHIISGRYLPDILDDCRLGMALLGSTGQTEAIDLLLSGSRQPAMQLMGLTAGGDCYDDEVFSESDFLERCAGAGNQLSYFYQGKIRNAYLFASADALMLARQQPLVARYAKLQLINLEATFYAALIRLRAQRGKEADPELAELVLAVTEWASYCPDNFADRKLLLEAESARGSGDIAGAMALYLRAADQASNSGHINIEALAYELYAEFMLDLGQRGIARGLLREAYRLYQNWGAAGKAAQLRIRHPVLEADERERRQAARQAVGGAAMSGGTIVASHTESRRADALDLAGILKANQALSSEVGLEQVLEHLMEIVLQNGGAQAAHLLLRDQSQWWLAASADGAGIHCPQRQAVDLDGEGGPFLLAPLRYTARSGEVLIQERKMAAAVGAGDFGAGDGFCADDGAGKAGDDGTDTAGAACQPLSLMCLPIKQHGQVAGILYLENNAMRGAFTLERVEFLRSLAVQALISIDNAGLYRELAQKVEARTQDLSDKNAELSEALDTLRQTLATLRQTQEQLVQQGKMAGLGSLTAGVAHEINNPTNFAHVAAQIQQTEIAEFQKFVRNLFEDDAPEAMVQAFDERFAKLDANVTTILYGTERIIGIVKDLRFFTQLDETDAKSVCLSACLTSSLNLVRTHWLEQVEFITQFSDDPEIECRPALLNQVFMNLLVNGCQAIAEKRAKAGVDADTVAPRGHLWLRLRREGAMLVAEVEDDGIGIPYAIQARVLEPFYTTKEVGSGTGLGLSISFGIVQKHGGRLDFTSTPGGGSCFAVRLPLAELPGASG